MLTLAAKECASTTLLTAATPLVNEVALPLDSSALDEQGRTLFAQVRRLSQVHVNAPVERRRLWDENASLESIEETFVAPSGIGVVSRRRQRP
ncbi:MAG: hypothetical protein QM784_29890 [Polyangiaceae bacterium]